MINRKIILSSVIAGVVSLSASHHVTAALPNFQQGQEGVHVNNQNMQVVQQRPPVQLPHHIAMNVLQVMPHVRGTGVPAVTTQDVSNFEEVSKKYGDVIADTRINTLPIKKLDDKNKFPNMQTQVFYAENDFRLPTYEEIKEARDILIFVDMFGDNFGYDDYQINRFRNIRAEEPTIVHARFEYPMDMTYNAVQNIVASDGQHYDKMKFKNVSMKISEALDISRVNLFKSLNEQDFQHYREVDGINRFYLDKAETQEILITGLRGKYNEANGTTVDLSRFSHVNIFGNDIFCLCQNITSVKLPNNLREIPYNCFRSCTALIKINLDNINVISHHAFFLCPNLKLTKESLKNAEEIDVAAFSLMYVIEGVTIDELDLRNLTSIQRAFARRGLQRVTLSENMYDRVPENAFDEKVVITYVNSAGKITGTGTLAERENLFEDFRNLFK